MKTLPGQTSFLDRVGAAPCDPHVEDGTESKRLGGHNAAILAALRRGGLISALDLEIASGSRRVAARVRDLEKAGCTIKGEWIDRRQGIYGYKLLEAPEHL